MFPAEPSTTAALLVTFGVLMAVSVLFSRASGRIGVPVALLFLGIGMAAGEDGFGIRFNDYGFAFRAGTAALALILFDGGLNTPVSALRQVLRPAAVLATAGVAGTAALMALAAWLLGFDWRYALLLGAVVSSTDAAAVFSVLRGSGLQLKKRLGLTIELESGLNDPMAVILSMELTRALVSGTAPDWRVAFQVPLQLAVGGLFGAAIGYGGRHVLPRLHLVAGGLYPVLTLAIAFVAFGLPTLLYGSGFLAVYVAGVVLGNGPMPLKTGVLRVHDAIAWFSQVSMFLLLGLLVTPSALFDVALTGTLLGLVLAFFARPVVVALCLLPFRYPAKEIGYIGWVGLRGAVPIILATFPVLAGVRGAELLFNIVFFVVVVNAIIPGATVRAVTRWLGLESKDPPPPPAVLEIASTHTLKGEVLSFYIEPALAVCGSAIADLPFPPDAAAMLIVRGDELIAPRGNTVLQPHDHLYVFCRPADEGFIRLMFGRPEQE
ncbi:MAG: potassium/proton antiporter [Myxococcales bacterium]